MNLTLQMNVVGPSPCASPRLIYFFWKADLTFAPRCVDADQMAECIKTKRRWMTRHFKKRGGVVCSYLSVSL